MHFIIEQNLFLTQIQRCQQVVDKKKINPVLSNILLKACNNGIQLLASDGQMYLLTHVPLEIKEEGSAIIPAKILFDIVRELPSNYPVECILKDHVLCLKCGRSRFKLNTMDADAFPAPPEERIEDTFNLPAPALAKMIQSIIFCISSDESRKFLTGGSFVFDNDAQRLRIRTSNGYHMGLASLPLNTESVLSECIIPQRTLLEIRRLCESQSEPVVLAMGPHQVCFSTQHTTLYSKVIEDSFPSFSHLVPQQMVHKVELDKTELEQVLRRCLLVSNESPYDVCFTLTDGMLEVTAQNKNQESALEQINADITLTDDLSMPYSFGMNAMFLREVLSSLPGQYVQIHFQDAQSAMKIISRDDEMTDFIMMPLRLD